MKLTSIMSDEEILKGQFFATCVFLVVIISNISLIYNQILINDGCEGFLTEEEASNINLLSRTLALVLFFYFLYTALITYDRKEEKGFDELLELIAAIIATVAGYISFYLATKNYTDFNLDSIENPEI